MQDSPLKSRNRTILWPNNLTTRHIPRENKNWERCIYPNVHCSTITIARTWKQSRSPLTDWQVKKLWYIYIMEYSVQFSSVAQSCLTLCDPMNRSTPGLPVHHQLPEFTQTNVHWVRDAIKPSHPLSSPSPPIHNPSQCQSLFQWVNSSHEVSKVLEFQL